MAKATMIVHGQHILLLVLILQQILLTSFSVSAFTCTNTKKKIGNTRSEVTRIVDERIIRHFGILLRASTTLSTESDESESKSESRRDMEALFEWAKAEGVQFDNSALQPQTQDGDDFALVTAKDVSYDREKENDDDNDTSLTVLQVPWHLVLSSERIRQELHANIPEAIQKAEEFLTQKKVQEQLPQFYLFVKLWREYHKGKDSLWYPWIASFPESFDTAVCYDDVEMECLPPFAWALASVERHHLQLFREALKIINGNNQSNDDADDDDDLVRWIFNCVFTRCWSHPDDNDKDKRGRCDIVPLGDMFNHNAHQTIRVDYDDEDGGGGDGNVAFSLRHDQDHRLEAGAPLYLSYGLTTNPFRFLVIFGFVDETQPEVFCQILSQEPSQRLVDMGYDSSQMVFRTEDGAIANAVWDVMMYNLLEQVPELQEAFYQAHKNNDARTKKTIFSKFHLEAAMLLHKHVSGSLSEFLTLLDKANKYHDKDHPRLSMIQRHLDFMISTFTKVLDNLNATIQKETKSRKELQEKQ